MPVLLPARRRGDRGKGLNAPPIRLRQDRDPIRLFSRSTIAEVYREQGYVCTNPRCEFTDVPLEAHHIIAHALGGRTIRQNLLMLCRSCHSAVHRGVIPLEVLVAWRQRTKNREPMTDPDEIIARARSVPVTDCGGAHERLVTLNRILLQANALSSSAARKAAFAQVLLAKAAVLNDTARDFVGTIPRSVVTRSWRYRRLLPLGAAAARFADEIGDHATLIRGLHYRAVAYTTLGQLENSLKVLRSASQRCASYPAGREATFHPLSTPGRIMQELGVTRARLGGSRTQARKEFDRGACWSIGGGEEEANGTHVRRVKLEMGLGNLHGAEHQLDLIWHMLPLETLDSRLSLYALRAELLLASGAWGDAAKWVQVGLAEAVGTGRHRQEFQLRTLEYRCELQGA